MAEVTEFTGILSARGQASGASVEGGDGLIRWALAPVHAELNAALACCDQERALRIAYSALGRVADAVASMHGDVIFSDQVRLHALLVQLLPLPIESRFDGTLDDMGTQVEIRYRGWTVTREEASVWGQRLTQQCQALWPGAWIVVTG